MVVLLLTSKFLTMNMKDMSKINILSDTFAEFFGKRMNLARIMFIYLAIRKIRTKYNHCKYEYKFCNYSGTY